MNSIYFRPRKIGPEIIIEDTIANQIPFLFPNNGHLKWVARSLPLGASIPDLMIVSHKKTKKIELDNFEVLDSYILSYLRSTRCARIDTIFKRIGGPKKEIFRGLMTLINANAVIDNSNKYSISPKWRNILEEVITIEAKVKNWKVATVQAVRNLVFANKSYVALPIKIAERIYDESIIRRYGIGVISVNDNRTKIIRTARHHRPRIWAYYYQLAFFTAKQITEEE